MLSDSVPLVRICLSVTTNNNTCQQIHVSYQQQQHDVAADDVAVDVASIPVLWHNHKSDYQR